MPFPKEHTTNQRVGWLAQAESEIWAMEPRGLKSLFSQLSNGPADIPAGDIEAAEKTQTKTGYRLNGDAAVISVRGILLKQIPAWFSYWGIEATSYVAITEQIRQALGDRQVSRIELDVDSPGGLVNGVVETADTIRAARDIKPVDAVVEDLSASAAYWLSAQATAIAAQRTSMVGSIGVYTVYVDWSKAAEDAGATVHVIRSGVHKGMGVTGAPISDEQIAAVQELIDGTADQFVKAVAAGRQRKVKDVTPWATGRLWLAEPSLKMGLIDSVYNTTAHIKRSMKGFAMEKEEETQQAARAEAARIEDQTRSDERRRLSELRTAFADDPAFAMQAFEKGQTVVEAKADYCDALREQLAAAVKERDDLTARLEKKEEKTQSQADGKPPVATDSSDTAATGDDFLCRARELAKTEGISVTLAMRKLARQQPELHQAYVKAG